MIMAKFGTEFSQVAVLVEENHGKSRATLCSSRDLKKKFFRSGSTKSKCLMCPVHMRFQFKITCHGF